MSPLPLCVLRPNVWFASAQEVEQQLVGRIRRLELEPVRATSNPLVTPGCCDEVPGCDHLSFSQRHIALAPNPHHRYGDLWPVLGEDQAEVGPVDVDRRGQPPRAREV